MSTITRRSANPPTSTSGWRMLSTLLLSVSVLAGCATSNFGENAVMRPLSNAPDRFFVGTFGGTSIDEPTPGTGCRNPMVDPRDRTELELIRSNEGVGDYYVSQGRYGVGAGELIRIDCGTGDPLGIVSR